MTQEKDELQHPDPFGTLRPQREPITRAQIAKFWDVAIAAHYLIFDIAEACRKVDHPVAAHALVLREILDHWVTRLTRELDELEKAPPSS